MREKPVNFGPEGDEWRPSRALSYCCHDEQIKHTVDSGMFPSPKGLPSVKSSLTCGLRALGALRLIANSL